ncbi:MAG: NADH-quinone oxidoreductase subunit NuoH [Bacteroidia bacterium]|nr:NADH-quinone oxidoreductase subunit NuoH [Bacteroidia bacterium]
MDPILSTLVLILVCAFVFLTAAAYTVYAERRICAFIQQRKGPNRVGPFGLLQPAADAIKLLFKEDIIPAGANKFMHFLAPALVTALAVLGMAMLPFTRYVGADGVARTVQIFDANIGILFVLAVTSISVYGITLAGWSSNSKYALLGGLRSSAQMISYELSMGLSVVSVLLWCNYFLPEGQEYLRLSSIVEAQRKVWFVFVNPIAFFIFVTCAFAETNRTPFDLVEAEQELVGGFHTEYSGMKFGAFFVGEYLNVIIASAMISTLFLGGYLGPFETALGVQSWSWWAQAAWGLAWFSLKTLFFVFVFIWVRWTLPRFKYNQLMDLGWKRLLPISIANLMAVAAIAYAFL